MLGGRTNHWGRISLRMGPYDFKPYTRDSLGFDWPMDYSDLAPYYDKVEELIGVFGSMENQENAPDGKFLPPPKPRCTELFIQRACKKLNIPCISSRLSILTKSINGRPACHYCGQCGRGCATRVEFFVAHSADPAGAGDQESGNQDRRDVPRSAHQQRRTRYRHFLHRSQDATGVSSARQNHCVVARARVNPRACCSFSTQNRQIFQQDSGNSSGEVGKALMDTVGSHLTGYSPRPWPAARTYTMTMV